MRIRYRIFQKIQHIEGKCNWLQQEERGILLPFGRNEQFGHLSPQPVTLHDQGKLDTSAAQKDVIDHGVRRTSDTS